MLHPSSHVLAKLGDQFVSSDCSANHPGVPAVILTRFPFVPRRHGGGVRG
jgi:hypothetical protein